MLDVFSGQIKHLTDSADQIHLDVTGGWDVIAEAVEALEDDGFVVDGRQLGAAFAPFFQISNGEKSFSGRSVRRVLASSKRNETGNHFCGDVLKWRKKLKRKY